MSKKSIAKPLLREGGKNIRIFVQSYGGKIMQIVHTANSFRPRGSFVMLAVLL